ncbi:MAG: hypothetical protein M3539_15070, partial [Acidobacteriota bacterium]|nr:hypothetical protein [Acidobacteriota bacterium]
MTELFGNFEVNRDLRWPVILRILGGSFAFHVLAIACLLYVPGIRDAFNIAALIADTTFVDKPYDRTEIGDDIQFVQLSGEKFRYPDGYWAMESQPVAAMIPPAPAETPFFVQAQPITPAQPEASPSPDASPTSSPSTSPGATPSPAETVTQANASPSPGGQKQTAEEAQKQLEKIAAENNLT